MRHTGSYRVYVGCIGFSKGNIGIMEKKMENTTMGYIGVILGMCLGFRLDDSPSQNLS